MSLPLSLPLSRPVYLDYAATTPVDPRVAEQMLRYLGSQAEFGNPGSTTHAYGWAAEKAVDQARRQVAAAVGANPREIIWTSGATESNNLALKGAAKQYQKKGRHLITCKTEHKAVLDACLQLEREGFEVTYLNPEPNGLLDLDKLKGVIRDDTLLVSIMQVNNEIGVIQDIAAIGQLTRERGALLHVDAAQSVGKVRLNLAELNVDLMSFCAHKVYGPKGIGALYVRRRPRLRLEALIHGGGQERGLRAGTLPTHQIAAMGLAFELAAAEFEADKQRLIHYRQQLWQTLQDLGAIELNGDPDSCVAGIMNVSFAAIDGEALMMALDDIAVSTGSACTSAMQEPSHVLRAIGCDAERAHGSIRLSFGRFTTQAEINHTCERLRQAVNHLRNLSPLWEAESIT